VLRDSVRVAGEPLELEGVYNVGTKDFLLDGKDGYGSFHECRLVRGVDDCLTLQSMIVSHLEALEQLNENVTMGDETGDESAAALALPARQLLEVARATAASQCGSIARYDAELGLYAVDPAVEGRIVCMPGRGVCTFVLAI
jgi:hypothetical protein